MFEITGDDIAALNDEDLRTLVGFLCEAELRKHALPLAAVTYGGNQTAKDGGLDVRVSLPPGTAITGFIPRPSTGFQAKKSDMPRAAILDEMRPGGDLRPSIAELADASGAYIIVSANGSTSDTALTSRRDAMAEAVNDLPGGNKLALDFYDRTRVATWVRDHAGVILWVRARIDKSVPGWRPFGSWSHVPEGADPAYIADDTARIKTGGSDEGDGLSATDGINKIREALRKPGSVVRLVGLSGVGKTRLVEALFDPALGTGSLDPSQAIYTNVAEGPDPQPAGLASDLIATRARAVLIIDNCPSDLHRQLSEITRSAGTTISVITVEYDIRDDQPEGTDVFTLETSSLALIETLVAKRYPGISQIDARTVAEFSGGNARVALALAATVGKNETIAGLSDADLFQRLFQQRHEHDAGLLSIAQACSLVYSFEGEKTSGDDAELPVLASLIGKTADEVFSGVAELKRRDLLQERSVWRAILPHAIANRLAAMALQNIPRATLTAKLVQGAPERLLQSFSRRLGYLDNCKEAKAVVESWLAPGGLLADLPNLLEVGRAMFQNVAPVAPDAVLAAMETALAHADEATFKKCNHFIRLLRSLAYDAVYFERALALLLKFAQQPRGDSIGEDEADEADNAAASLFSITLSGTHAPVEMRLKAVETMLRSPEASVRSVGVEALETMLKSDHFSSSYAFEFGARSRDYGYHPRTGDEVRDWFGAALKLSEQFSLSDNPAAPQVQKAIANEFRSLWSNSGQNDALDRIARAISTKNFWRDGWLAARSARIYEGKQFPPEILTQLLSLEESLRPKDLVSKVRGLVIGTGGGHLELDDPEDVEDNDFEGAAARAVAAVTALAKDVAVDGEAFAAVLPELKGSSGKLRPFGEGLAQNADDPRAMWDAIVAQFVAGNELSFAFTGGFLSGLHNRDAALANTFLDEAVEHLSLATIYPILQANVVVDAPGLARLHKALALGKAPIASYYNLAWGRASDTIPGPNLKDLVLAIGCKPDGLPPALEIISMRLHADANDKRATVPEIREAGRALLTQYTFHKKDSRTTREDHELSVVIKASLAGSEGIPVVQRLCRDLMAAVATYEVHAHDQDDLIKALFHVHPSVMLDELFAGDEASRKQSMTLLNNLNRFNRTALDDVPDEVILDWCSSDPKIRYPIAAAGMTLFRRASDKEPNAWTDLARKLLENAPDPRAILDAIVYRLRPMSWSGSLATKLESRLKLLGELPVGDVPDLKAALEHAKGQLRKQIDGQRQRETQEDRARSGRFE